MPSSEKKFQLKIKSLIHKVITSREHWKKISMVVVGGIIALFLIIWLGQLIGEDMKLFASWIKELGWLAHFVFIVSFIVLTLGFFPETLLAILGGIAFGLWKGFLVVIVANCLAAICAFYLYRLLFKNRFDDILKRYPRVKAIKLAVAQKGFTLMLLLRLGPFNFSFLNLVFGASNVNPRAFVSSLIGVIPGNFMTVYLGILTRHLAQKGAGVDDLSTGREISMIFGFVITVIVCMFIAHFAHHALKEAESQHQLE